MPPVIGRIALPKSTTLSLNERFSHLHQLRLQQQLQRKQQLQPTAASQPSSLENRRLVLDLERRASVQAALNPTRLKRPALAVQQKRLHVKQRLAVQYRLGVLRPAAARGATVAARTLASRLGKRRVVKRLPPARVTRPVSQLGGRGRGRGRAKTLQTRPSAAYTVARGTAGGWRGGGGRGRGRGRGYLPRQRVSREDLDRQLDEYMRSTKHSLDAELDAYMKECDL